MKTKVEVLESGATKLTVTVEAADIDVRIKKTYKEFGKKYKFPGFRPGHVPRQIIDNNMGKDYVRQTVTEELLNESFPVAIDESGIYPISQPIFNEAAGLIEEGADYVFSAEFEVKPEIELSDYAPVHVVVPVKNATEEEIDEQIAALGNYYYDFKNAPANTKVKADSCLDITLSAKDDNGEDVEALAAEDRHYELGQGLFPAAFDEALVGMKKGETKTIELNVKENPCMLTSMLQDKTENVTFEVEVKAVKKKVVPEFTDEWVKENLGVADVAELRANMGASIEQQKAQAIPRIMENNALYELQKRVEGDVPAAMLEDAERDLLQNFFTQMQQQGATLDAYLKAADITADKFKEDVKLQAADTVRQNLALDAWARHAGIVVTDEEVADEFKNSGAEDADALYKQWKAEGRLHDVREGIMRGKALEALLKDAEIEEVEKMPEAEEEAKPAKKAAKKSSKKAAKAEEAPAEDAAAE